MYKENFAGNLERDHMNGVLVVKAPRWKEPAYADYDYDLPCHVISVDDAAQFLFDFQWPGYYQNMTHLPMKEVSLVVNGKGSYNVRIYQLNICIL